MLTIDIGFPDAQTYRAVHASGAFDEGRIGALYGLDPSDVEIYAYDPASTIKISLPRPAMSAGVGETDFDGVQQYIPLLSYEVCLTDDGTFIGDRA